MLMTGVASVSNGGNSAEELMVYSRSVALKVYLIIMMSEKMHNTCMFFFNLTYFQAFYENPVFIGCYQDVQKNRDFPVSKEISKVVTIEQCARLCRRYTFIGLQIGESHNELTDYISDKS